MLNLSPEQDKKVLIAALAVLALLVIYRVVTADNPRTAPLTYTPGAVARSDIRQGPVGASSNADSLNVLLARREEKFPSVLRDIFRMGNPAPKPKPHPVIAAPPPPPPVPQRTPEEIAADMSRADLIKFRFLGYMAEKDKTLFLSKEGELFIVKSGDRLLKSYQVKEVSKDYVELVDTTTKVAMRINLSGTEPQQVPYASAAVQQQQALPNSYTSQQTPTTQQILQSSRSFRR
jgi:hypothetical protein